MKYKCYSYNRHHKCLVVFIFSHIILLVFTLLVYIPLDNSEFDFKLIDSTNYKPIADAIFQLSDISSNKSYISYSTDNGIVSFSNIPAGTYLLTQVVTPNGYLPNNAKYNINISFDGAINFENRPISELIITNIPDKTFKVTYISSMQTVSYTAYASENYCIIDYPFSENQDYKFVNWNTSSDSSGTTYKPGEIINLKRDLILYAVFEPLD